MPKIHKLSLFSSILININIMLGSGIFINTSILTSIAGSLGALIYLLVGILLLPLVLSITKLWQSANGACTFYHFGSTLSPFFGFLNSWGYFIGKLCSATLGIHVCVSLLQQIFPALTAFSTIKLDAFVITLFTIFNLLNLKLGKSIQYSFLAFKLIPILFVFFTSFFLYNINNFTGTTFLWQNIPAGIPFVIYAFSGFEATCSLSQIIDNPEKNGPKAILISYFIVLVIVTLFQLLFYGDLGMQLAYFAQGYLDAYPALLSKLILSNASKNILLGIIYIGIACSTLGAAYGILFSNYWNLFTLAKNNHTFAPKILTSLNKHNIPYMCVILEGLICLSYLFLSFGKQIPLQQGGALGSIIAYTISMIAFAVSQYRKRKTLTVLSVLSLLSCFVLITSFIWSISKSGLSILFFMFFGLLLFGSYMFYAKHEPSNLEVFEQI